MPIRIGPTELTLLHISKLKIFEIYSVFRETDGTAKVSLLQSKGDGAPIKKSGIMIGNCSKLQLIKVEIKYFRLELLRV